MINCQIIQDGKVKDRVEQQNGLVFCDNHGVERSNRVTTPLVDAALDEWHYDKFGIMHQHFHGKENNTGFRVMHEVRPAMMFSIATKGQGSKNVYQNGRRSHELVWNTGNANLCFINGEGGLQVNLNRDQSLDLLSVVIPQPFIESLIELDEQTFEPLAVFIQCSDNTHVLLRENRPVEQAVVRAVNDIDRARLMGNSAHRYLESKIIDCLSGFLDPGCLSPASGHYSLLVRDKIHDAKDIILAQYHDMPSLHQLATMVGTNECTLKRVFKQEFGATVFQFLFDYRMDMATHYLLDTLLPIGDIGAKLGYEYPSHFCTAFKRKYGVSPMEYRACRGAGPWQTANATHLALDHM